MGQTRESEVIRSETLAATRVMSDTINSLKYTILIHFVKFIIGGDLVAVGVI